MIRWAEGNTLHFRHAFLGRNLLPTQFTAVLGLSRALRRGNADVAIRCVVLRPDIDAAEHGERHEMPDNAAAIDDAGATEHVKMPTVMAEALNSTTAPIAEATAAVAEAKAAANTVATATNAIAATA